VCQKDQEAFRERLRLDTVNSKKDDCLTLKLLKAFHNVLYKEEEEQAQAINCKWEGH
jgi:hypothetical protein